MGRKYARIFTPLIVVAAGLAFTTQDLPAKPDYTRRTSLACEYCHPPNSRDLNEAGHYFAEHKRSMAGYKPKEQPKEQPQEPAKQQAKSKPAPRATK